MTRRKEPRRPRSKRTWELNPVQKAYSVPKGGKGYARSRKRELPREELWVKLHDGALRHPKVVVLLSGEGHQFNEILSYVDRGILEAEVLAVISDNPGAVGVGVASTRGIRTLIVDPAGFGEGDTLSGEISRILDKLDPDVVVLDDFAGSVRLRDKKNRRVVDRAETLFMIAATN